MGNLPKGYKYQVVGKRAKMIGKTSFIGGYDIFLYPPKGAFERSGKYMNMKEVKRSLGIVKRNLLR